MSVLIEETNVENKKLRSVIQEINAAVNKNDLTKIKGLVPKLLGFLADDRVTNRVLYTYSILAEKYPIVVQKIDNILVFLDSSDTSIRLNAAAIFGLYLKEHLDKESERIEFLLHFLDDSELEIRENAAIVIEELKDQISETLFSELPLLIKRAEDESSSVVKEILVTVMNDFIGKDILTTKKVEGFYLEQLMTEKSATIRNLMFCGLERYLFGTTYEQESEKKRFEQIKNRKPLLILHDLSKEAKESGLSLNELKDFYKDERAEGKISGIFDLDGKKKLFVEYEKEGLIEYLSQGRIPVKDMMSNFSLSLTFINRLIKTLIKNHEIRGFLTDDYFLSSMHIKANIERDFKANGFINLPDYPAINPQFILAILKELQEENRIQGFFNRNLSQYYSFNAIRKELELEAGNSVVLDLQSYQDSFAKDAFAEIERECERKIFTPFKTGTIYLTHLGKLKIDQVIKDASKLGTVEVARISQELGIPTEILVPYLHEALQNKNGFWTENNEQFFFYQYFDSELAKAGKAGAQDAAKLQDLSDQFQMPLEDIQAKMHARKQKIIDRIKEADAIVVREYMDELGFGTKNEFLTFVDALGRQYLDVGNSLIFDEEKITQKKVSVRNELRNALNTEDIIRLTNWGRRLNVPPSLVEELFNNLIQEENRNVLKIGDDAFVTESGIERRMLDNPEMFELDSLFLDLSPIPLDEIQLQAVSTVLRNLVSERRLNGFYDEETQTFMDSSSMAAMGLNVKRNQVVDFIEDTKRQTFASLDQIKAYVNGEMLGPSQISGSENIVKALEEKYRQWNSDRDRLEHSFAVTIREHKSNLKTIADEDQRSQEEARLNELETEVNNAVAEFKSFRGVIDGLSKDIGKIFHLIKTIRRKPENVEAMQERLEEMLGQYFLN